MLSKSVKIILSTTLISIIIIGCSTINNVPKNYTTQIETQASLEKQYTNTGILPIENRVFSSNQSNFSKYKIWYPKDNYNNKVYPLIIFANGAGVSYQKYEPIFEHLATWGFIVIGNDDKSSWDGLSSAQSLNFALTLNNDPKSSLYKKIDLEKIGLAGHSQGGVAVLNAVNKQKNGNLYRSIFGASTTKLSLAKALKWDYDINQITIPYFYVAGTGGFDAGNLKDPNSGIAPLQSMQENFVTLPNQTPVIMARRKDSDHGKMLYIADGYMTAWFLYTLKGDRQAKLVFVGKSAEISHNPLWQDVKSKNLK